MTDDRTPDDRTADRDFNGLTDEDRMLAAEYALGASEGTDRAGAARRAAHDPAFRREVEAWHEWLQPMLDEVADETPPASVWRGIEAAIGRADARVARAAPTVAERARRAAAPVMAPWRALALMGLGGALTALVLVVAVERGAVRLGPSPVPAPLVATLTTDGAPSALARLDERGALVVRVDALGADDGLVPELWLIPADGSPVSLGLPGEGRALTLPDGVTPATGETLAVSLEPPGGSTTGAPTGPVIATGALVEL